MQRIFMNIWRLWILAIVVIIYSGCTGNETQQLVFQTQVASTIYANQTAKVQAASSTPTHLPTAKPTRTPQPTPTSTITVTPTLAIALVGTPFRLPKDVISPLNANQLSRIAEWGQIDGKETVDWDQWNEFETPLVTLASYSANGRYLAISTQSNVILFEALSHTIIQRIDINLPVASMAFSADGSLLAIGYPGFVELWQVSQGQLLRVLKLNSIDPVVGLVFSTDGQTILMGVAHHTLFWPIEADSPQVDIKFTHVIDNEERALPVQMLAVSPDGMYFAASTTDGTLWLGSVTERRILFDIKNQAQAIHNIAFTTDGTNIITAGDVFSLFQVSDGKLIHKQTTNALNVSVSFDGNQVAILSDGEVSFFQLPWMTKLHTFPVDRNVIGLSFSPDGRSILTWGDDLRLVDISSGAINNILLASLAAVTHLTFSPDSSILAAHYADGIIRIWRVRDGIQQLGLDSQMGQSSYQDYSYGYGLRPYHLAFSPDGKHLAMPWSGEYLFVVRPSDGKLENILKAKECDDLSIYFNPLSALAYNPDGSLLATNGSTKNKICLWQTTDFTLQRTLSFEGAVVTSLAFSPKGDQLAAGTEEGEIRMWETVQWKLLWSQFVQQGAIFGLAFSNDGNLIASAGADGSLRLHMVEDGANMSVFAACEEVCLGVSFSPDNQLLAVSMSGYGHKRLYLVGTDKTIEWGDGRTTTGIAFSQDGKYLAAGHEDGSISLWAIP